MAHPAVSKPPSIRRAQPNSGGLLYCGSCTFEPPPSKIWTPSFSIVLRCTGKWAATTRTNWRSRSGFPAAISRTRWPTTRITVFLRRWKAPAVGGAGVVVVPWPGSGKRSQPRRAWILNVYVHQRYRRQGIAKAMMEALISWCRLQEFDCICLHASTDGRPLYELLGFEVTNEMRFNLTPVGNN
ncbi:MAG: GNAT family N-acetyltransferase [Acidobacteriota bacterium]